MKFSMLRSYTDARAAVASVSSSRSLFSCSESTAHRFAIDSPSMPPLGTRGASGVRFGASLDSSSAGVCVARSCWSEELALRWSMVMKSDDGGAGSCGSPDERQLAYPGVAERVPWLGTHVGVGDPAAQHALLLEADLFQHARGGAVVDVADGPDATHLWIRERQVDYRTCRLGHQPASPMRATEHIAEVMFVATWSDRDHADELVIAANRERPCEVVAGGPAGLALREVLLG